MGVAAAVDNAMVNAPAPAFRWRKMLDAGVHATLDDLARAKGVNATYVSRILRLTLLAPGMWRRLLARAQAVLVTLIVRAGASGRLAAETS